ncbi:MAG: peptidyl-prolyl cis-trans isomerase [Phycisphaerae bacterium]|nr:MAG: peptidyl-prolyl cis-trans isomerase [Phycisphaerae bacterium]
MALSATIKTNKGDINVEFFDDDAPITVSNFVNLAQRGYYDGVKFHRVIDNFMIQTGDPKGNGTGGPGYEFEDEFTPSRRHDSPGVLSMANRGPTTNGSQFFITHLPTPHLDGKHTVFGKVTKGQDVVDSIAQGDSMTTVEVEGDAGALLEAQSKNVAAWNKVLDRNYPVA